MNHQQSQYIVIRGGRIFDAVKGETTYADVLIKDDKIMEVGPVQLQAPKDATVINAENQLLIPGLVNGHTHGHAALGKGRFDRWSLELLLSAVPWINGERNYEDMYLAAKVNAAEMALKGCTSAYDMYTEFPVPSAEGMAAVARGYADVGIRAAIAPMVADRLLYEAIPGMQESLPSALRSEVEKLATCPYSESVRGCEEFLKSGIDRMPGITVALAPTIPLHCTDDFMLACRDMANDYGIGIQMHLGETKVQALSGVARYGKSLTQHLGSLGLLSPNFTGAHSIWLDDDDFRLLADRGCSVVHNPMSNLRIGSGVAPVRRMLDQGINVSIGTDGSNASDSQNMFEATRLASFLSRIVSPEIKEWLSVEEVLAMATTGGAGAMGLREDIGKIEQNYSADIVFLDLSHINYIPLNDPLRQVVFCENAGAVHSVMVRGRMIVQDGRLLTIDLESLACEVERAMERLNSATGMERKFAQKLETHVCKFCIGLQQQSMDINRMLNYRC